MKKNKLLAILFLSTIVNSTTLHAFDLITKDEYKQFSGHKNDKQKKAKFRSISSEENSPNIAVEQPIIGTKINSPTDIKLSFKASTNTKIDIDSLQFLYGWLSLDITDRIKNNATITAYGLSAANVTLPTGDHVITVKISDSEGRTTEKEIEFTIN